MKTVNIDIDKEIFRKDVAYDNNINSHKNTRAPHSL